MRQEAEIYREQKTLSGQQLLGAQRNADFRGESGRKLSLSPTVAADAVGRMAPRMLEGNAAEKPSFVPGEVIVKMKQTRSLDAGRACVLWDRRGRSMTLPICI
jgi:hypothetical protein